MKIIQMSINGSLQRIDNSEVRRNEKGYYINVLASSNLFYPTFKKIYLTDMESKEYKQILEHNSKVDKREQAIQDAKKAGRVIETIQYVSSRRSGVIGYTYIDENGKAI